MAKPIICPTTGRFQQRHGKTGSPELSVWIAMRSRCRDSKVQCFNGYGGRGIKVCERWDCEYGFENFLADMGKRPSADHSIDRIDNNGDYCPEHCRWSTRSEQAQNRRSSRMLTMDGKTQCMSAWAKEYGMTRFLLYSRLKLGWDLRRSLTEPIDTRKWRKGR